MDVHILENKDQKCQKERTQTGMMNIHSGSLASQRQNPSMLLTRKKRDELNKSRKKLNQRLKNFSKERRKMAKNATK